MKHFFRKAGIAPALLVLAALAAPASAKDVTLTVSTPTNKANATVTISFNKPNKGGLVAAIPVAIKPGLSATEKRDAILAAIAANKVPKFTVAAKGTDKLTLSSLQQGSTVTFEPGATGEAKDFLTASLTSGGSIDWGSGSYATLDSFGQQAEFTAGFITDKGTASFSVTPTLLGVTPGSLTTVTGSQINEALFSFLNPVASAFGGTLTDNGTSFDVGFDPNFTQGESGIVFGTTSTSSGVAGTLSAPVPEASSLLSFGLMLALGGAVAVRRKNLKT